MITIARFERRRLVPRPTAAAPSFLAALSRETWLWSLSVLVLDLMFWSASFGVVCLLRGVQADSASRLVVLGLCSLAATVLMLFIMGGYDRRSDMMSLTYMSEHLIGLGAAVVAASLLVYCFASYDLPTKPGRATLLLSFMVFTPLSLVYRRALCARTRAEQARKHFLVLGSGEVLQRFFDAYKRSTNRQGLRFIEIAPRPAAMMLDGADDPRETEAMAELDAPSPELEGVIVALPVSRLGEALRDRLVRFHFQRAPVYTLDAFYETYWRRVPVFALDPSWPLQIGFQLSYNSPYRHAKRLFDVLSALLGLILLSPLFGLIAVLTLLDSGRPVIFRQERVGRGNERFTMFKFRSMRNRPLNSDDDLYTRTNDQRITRVGKWLRKLRLDELPQLWNVLRGDMSLIGPRAEWVKCAEIYEGKIPSYHFRHLVKPGITGWAQVNYSYGENEEDALQKLKYDLYYILRYSLRLDAMIVLKTLHIMFWGKGQ